MNNKANELTEEEKLGKEKEQSQGKELIKAC